MLAAATDRYPTRFQARPLNMSNTATTNNSKVKATVIGLFVVSLVVCGGPLTWWFGRKTLATRKLTEKRAEIVARGLPIDDASMEDYRYSKMSREHSEAWMRILEMLDSKEFHSSCEGIPIVGVPEEEIEFIPGEPYAYEERVADFLEQWEDTLSKIHEITEGSGPIWTQVEFDSFSTLLPYVQNTRSVARLLDLEFEDAVRRDDRDAAFHCLMALVGTGRSLEAEPIIVAQLVRVAVNSIALEDLKMALELDLLDENQLRKLLRQLRTIDDFGPKYRTAIVGERAMAQQVFDDPSGIGRYGDSPAISLPLGARPIDALYHLDVMERAESVATEDLNQFFQQAEELDQALSREMNDAGGLRGFDRTMTNLLIPAMGAYGQAITREAMSVRIAKLAVAARLFEQRHGRWPQIIDELLEKSSDLDLGPVQPIGQKPFGFMATDDGVQLSGFPLYTGQRVTPDAPVDPKYVDESQRSDAAFWVWELKTPR